MNQSFYMTYFELRQSAFFLLRLMGRTREQAEQEIQKAEKRNGCK